MTPAFVNCSLNPSKLPNVDLMRVAKRAGRRAAGLRAHPLPERRVVHVAAAVVADGGADVFGHLADVAQQIFDALRLQLGILLERRVQVRDIRL